MNIHPGKRVHVYITAPVVWLLLVILIGSCKEESDPVPEKLKVESCYIGDILLQYAAEVQNVPLDEDMKITFSEAVDTVTARQSIFVYDENNFSFSVSHLFTDDNKTVVLTHSQSFTKNKRYIITIANTLKGSTGQTFSGTEYWFKTGSGNFSLKTITIDGRDFITSGKFYDISRQGLELELEFSESVDTNQIQSKFTLSGDPVFDVSFQDDFKKVNLVYPLDLEGYMKYTFVVSTNLKSATGNSFQGFDNSFFTEVDSTLKFPLISDDELLTLVQQQTFRFFYDYAHPVSGMSRERFNSGDIVTSGGSGFGVMALIVGMERGFITHTEGISHLEKIIDFLETCDRFHGAWSHWINGSTGSVIPFGEEDNGGDLVETSYMSQGLITIRQYLDPGDPVENDLMSRITTLLNEIEWDWYRNNQNVLYWHWSPNYGWQMNFKVQGYNEALITYIMAASSPTHTITASVYHNGWARNGSIRNGKTFYGYVLPVGYDFGGPLFFAHYSFLGVDPRNLADNYANYWTQNVNHSLINWAYCADNPKGYPNYSEQCWGLTAGDIPSGYGVSEPNNDRGVITPTAAVSSLPYSPEQSMEAIRFFYFILGDRLWGDYGFYDAFDVHSGWWADSFIAIDQGPQIVMIENYRTGLIWDLFMSAPEVQAGLTKLGFSY